MIQPTPQLSVEVFHTLILCSIRVLVVIIDYQLLIIV